MSFGFLLGGFLATANAGRVALAAHASKPRSASRALALALGAALIVAGAALADELLDGLEISPESFRIAAGMVLAATGLWTLLWPEPMPGPFAAVLVTPELACLAISFGADEPLGKVLGAAAIALGAAAIGAFAQSSPVAAGIAARFLAALQLVVAVALVVSGIRDV
jgi:small neutral amino acid transporter SnatA (MarC family)